VSPTTNSSVPTEPDHDALKTEADLTGEYIALRDEAKRQEMQHKENMEARYSRRMDEIERKMLARLDKGGVKSFKTDLGTAFKKISTRYSVGDADELFAWIEANGQQQMLKKDIRQDPIRDYLEEHQSLPPGVKVYSEVVVQFRK
jgi:hypothetical protein